MVVIVWSAAYGGEGKKEGGGLEVYRQPYVRMQYVEK
jgi:hypothetical protein